MSCIPKHIDPEFSDWYNLNVAPLTTCVWTDEDAVIIVTDEDEVICIDNI